MVVRYDRTHFSHAESRRIGRHLALARRSAGLSLASLARRLRLPEVTMAAYEAGRARFPVRLVFAAARALKVTPYHLLAGRADRILNPWGPSLVEWRRARLWEGPPAESSEAESEVEMDEQAAAGAVQGETSPEDGAFGPFSVLKGEEAERALDFLDESGPGGRLDDGDDEGW